MPVASGPLAGQDEARASVNIQVGRILPYLSAIASAKFVDQWQEALAMRLWIFERSSGGYDPSGTVLTPDELKESKKSENAVALRVLTNLLSRNDVAFTTSFFSDAVRKASRGSNSSEASKDWLKSIRVAAYGYDGASPMAAANDPRGLPEHIAALKELVATEQFRKAPQAKKKTMFEKRDGEIVSTLTNAKLPDTMLGGWLPVPYLLFTKDVPEGDVIYIDYGLQSYWLPRAEECRKKGVEWIVMLFDAGVLVSEEDARFTVDADGSHNSCTLCGDRGNVTVCDTKSCPHVYHKTCLQKWDLPAPKSKKAKWYCASCSSSQLPADCAFKQW